MELFDEKIILLPTDYSFYTFFFPSLSPSSSSSSSRSFPRITIIGGGKITAVKIKRC